MEGESNERPELSKKDFLKGLVWITPKIEIVRTLFIILLAKVVQEYGIAVFPVA